MYLLIGFYEEEGYYKCYKIIDYNENLDELMRHYNAEYKDYLNHQVYCPDVKDFSIVREYEKLKNSDNADIVLKGYSYYFIKL
jgi:hypothetical protein